MKPVSLKTLLILLVLPLFLLMGAVLFATGLGHTRDFLQGQLKSHAQDAATALALRLAPTFAEGDMAAVANTVDALFDSGYYSAIVLERPRGGVLLSRQGTGAIEHVPAWFMDLLPMSITPGQAEVTSGWKRVAEIRVVSHPGRAYLQLWQNAIATLLWTLGFSLTAAAALFWTLSRTLAPLRWMERLAMDVGAGRFSSMRTLPGTRELRHIGQALNAMALAVERMLGDKTRFIDRLQDELHHDPATRLFNRTFFQSALAAALDTARNETSSSVGLALLQLSGLEAVNASLGREAGDRLVMTTATALSNAIRPHDGFAARLNGSQFALVLEGCDGVSLEEAAEGLVQAVRHSLQEMHGPETCPIHGGHALATDRDTPSSLLARADAALRDAQIDPTGGSRPSSDRAPGQEDMRRLLRSAVEDIRLELAWQPLALCADRALEHFEAFARILDARGHALPAGAFVSLAVQEGLVSTLDRHVLAEAWISLGKGGGRTCSVNVSSHSLAQPDFIAWLQSFVTNPGRLCIECSLGALSATPSATEALMGLKTRGFRIVVDRFTPSAAALEGLARLQPDWVKVEGALCRHATTSPGARVLMRSLCDYAHELGIKVAATGVEREADIALLCGLGLDGMQGRVFDSPFPA